MASDRDTRSGSVLERAIGRGCVALALFGGLVLAGVALMTVVSIAGRATFSAPVPGDFELVELGTGVAIFCFLPYCQFTRGNVFVDIFTAGLSPRAQSSLDFVSNVLYTLIAGLLAWQLLRGGLEMRGYQETTMVLQIPVWLGYIPAVLGTAFLAIVCAFTSWRSIREVRAGIHPEGARIPE
ncbi:MAG TPA: TRAP transporter small permease [Ferrovibrio sp.]|uniref:TRAP transporter small permease n=1 Tax=Ferrovibrio sp. TaxID=1917215 RepID=UPI002ED1791F